jgi:hypothetical protein
VAPEVGGRQDRGEKKRIEWVIAELRDGKTGVEAAIRELRDYIERLGTSA